MNTKDLSIRIDQILAMSNEVLLTKKSHKIQPDSVDAEKFAGIRAASLSFVSMCYGKQHSHYSEIDEATKYNSLTNAQRCHGILSVIKDEINGGWIFTTKQLISAEIFSDFMEMADHLLEKGYKDPAAVMIGGVLEENLRQLCKKNSIPLEYDKGGKMTHKPADMLNSDLSKEEVYNKLDLKQVTAWLDLRNKAAHGNYNEYSKDQVELMSNGVTNFISRVC